MSDDKSRSEFESFYRKTAKRLPLALGNEPVRYSGGQYVNDFALFGWMVWEAARDQISDGVLTNEGAEPVLSQPAKVGSVRFGKGIKERLVIEAAQRHFEYALQPEVEEDRIERLRATIAAVHAPAPASVVLPETAAGVWHEGSPPNPWDSEWFLAKMAQGAFVVLRPLPEEYTYDFTTADGTYVMRKSIERWAQLSGSEYKAPSSTETATK